MSGNHRVYPEPKSVITSGPDLSQPVCQQPQKGQQPNASGSTKVATAAVAAGLINSGAFNMSILNANEFAPHPSIQCLSSCDTLLVQENYTSPLSGFNQQSRYNVCNKAGQTLFLAEEADTGCWKQVRPFQIHVRDAKGEEVIFMKKNCSCAFIHCANELQVFSPPDNLIGTVSEGCGFLHPTYYLIDAMLPDVPLFEITGPVCTCSCFCDDVDFPVFETGKRDRARVGFISKKWGGMVRELFTTSDTFGVTFPSHLDPKYKVLFLAACFLIDQKHFDRSA